MVNEPKARRGRYGDLRLQKARRLRTSLAQCDGSEGVWVISTKDRSAVSLWPRGLRARFHSFTVLPRPAHSKIYFEKEWRLSRRLQLTSMVRGERNRACSFARRLSRIRPKACA